MRISYFPDQFQSLFAPALFGVEGADAQTHTDVAVCEATSGSVCGWKRFHKSAAFAVNVSPLLRGRLDPGPMQKVSGLYAAPLRAVEVQIRVGELVSPAVTLCGAVRTLREAEPMTVMPLRRTLAPGERDEISVVAPGRRLQATVTSVYADGTRAGREFELSAATPVSTLVVDYDSLRAEGAQEPMMLQAQLSVEGIPCLEAEYVVEHHPSGACRLAWVNREGGVDHYTFPTELEACVRADAQRALGQGGWRRIPASRRVHRVLHSLFEPREVLEALAQIVSSPAVWIASPQGYTPVEVLGSEARTARHGEPVSLQVEIAACEQEIVQSY